jgi:aerobic-type carbon monoxide dehydrogenase small subunit (CoxS/CutS family)
MEIKITINGQRHELSMPPHRLLSELLREDLGLTGTKEACGMGDCGACTVLLEGRAVNACLVLAVDAHGKKLVTVEGLGNEEGSDPLQKSFIEKGAIQCGFCTPGMLMSAKALLSENPDPTIPEIKEALAGNLCRCTGYIRIVEAVRGAACRAPNSSSKMA